MTQSRPNYRIKTYDLSDFDQRMCLKWGTNNLLLLAYLLSPLVLGLLAWGLSDRERGLLIELYSIKDNLFLSASSALPALFFCMVMLFKDENGANALVRAVWRRGRLLIQLTAVFNCLVSMYIAFVSARRPSAAQVLIAGMSLAALIYALRSARLYDYFLVLPGKHKTQA